MENVRKLVQNMNVWKKLRGTNIGKNAKNVKLWDWKCEEAMDVDEDVFRDVKVKARDKGPVRKVSMRFYGNGDNSKAHLQCSCEWFLYYCEVALYNIESSDIKYSNGEAPSTTNPQEIPIICKHIYAALDAGASSRKPDKSFVKEQKKIKDKESKEKEQKILDKEKAKQRELDRRNKEKERLQKAKEREKERLQNVREKELERKQRARDIEQQRKEKELERRQKMER